MALLSDTISSNKYLSTFSKSLISASLNNELSADGPYTVFAPSELAFSKLFNGELPELMRPDHKEQLRNMLRCHIVDGLHPFSSLTNGKKLVSVNGRILEIGINNGYVYVNGAAIQEKDNLNSNGILHSVGSLIA